MQLAISGPHHSMVPLTPLLSGCESLARAVINTVKLVQVSPISLKDMWQGEAPASTGQQEPLTEPQPKAWAHFSVKTCLLSTCKMGEANEARRLHRVCKKANWTRLRWPQLPLCAGQAAKGLDHSGRRQQVQHRLEELRISTEPWPTPEGTNFNQKQEQNVWGNDTLCKSQQLWS